MKLSLVLSTHQAQFKAVAMKGDFEANVAKIAAWGYDGVELAVRDPALLDIDQVVTCVERNGLEVPAIGTGQAWGEEGLSLTHADPRMRAAAVRRLISHIPLAARLRATIIIGLIRGITPTGQTHEQSMAYLIDAIRVCALAARENGVRLALEPLNRYETDLIHSAAEGLHFLQLVAMENVGLLLDTYHMNIEEPQIESSLKLCGDKIFHVHVADSNRWHPGAGHIDFATAIETLRTIGYDGYLSGEFLPEPDADSAAQNGLATMRRYLSHAQPG